MTDKADFNHVRISRRGLLGGSLVLAGAGVGAGALWSNPKLTDLGLNSVSRWNDTVQSALMSPHQLASSYPAEQITVPFPFNAFYPESQAPAVDSATWRLQVAGRVADRRPRTIEELRSMPQEVQTTRLICIEGWSAVGRWGGVPLNLFMRSVGADLGARYVAFRCADDYWVSIDMPSALHPQTILATTFLDRPLPQEFGFPLRLRIPTKLGFKNAKHIVTIEITNDFPGGFWENQGYNWFAGL